ncbi:MAG: FapA family protein, partial [Desulfovibrio sp.]|nr:FapA family protein [Desulfovibrio sp.]
MNFEDTEYTMYYLRHYFDPDFRHTQLSPTQDPDGTVSLRYLGYVQNVVAGQVLAELVNLDVHPDAARDTRFIYQERHLPIGPNCAPHSENP